MKALVITRDRESHKCTASFLPLTGTFIRTRDVKRKDTNSKQNKLQGDKERGIPCPCLQGLTGKVLHPPH